MHISISIYERKDIPSVKQFNERLKKGNCNFKFPESNVSKMFPPDTKISMFKEYFLAKDENGEVRGGYMFINQEFSINNKISKVKFLQLPLSEAVVNDEYSIVGPLILQDVQKKCRYVFALGMGDYEYALPKILKRIGWHMYSVPFYFYISDPRAFIKDFEYINNLKKTISKRILLKIIELLRLLNLLVILLNLFSILYRSFNFKIYSNVKYDIIDEFTGFADELWETNKGYFSMVANRDKSILNVLYPKESKRFHRLLVSKDGIYIGWIVVICTKMNGDKYFGNLKVGTIVDSFSNPKYYEILVNQAVKYLKILNADLIIANNSNHKLGKAFYKTGFLKGPSNYILALSKGFKDFFDEKIDFKNSFIMRSDGDGPINL